MARMSGNKIYLISKSGLYCIIDY